jgi:dihydroorotate dehydrogenase
MARAIGSPVTEFTTVPVKVKVSPLVEGDEICAADACESISPTLQRARKT